MKRPPGVWILLSAGVLCLSLQHVYSLKATELIFGKTSSTTTTTETSVDGQTVTDASQSSENSTKTNLTGNPQIDYILDPNLPRELNGYNLSNYPFYNSMPEDIDFKCDGLHDGFYASVPHKCQVYHHCLFGTRYDFLCANYTAFDQKTFICHFVSEVDCNNSHKYWHRNDALYQAATTTTIKPTPISISPALTASPRRPSPALRRRRPSRRRPQYEYYDEDYEEDVRDDYYEDPQPRRRRKRPRPRRPVYDDYDDYEDDRYERRGGSGRRNDNKRDPEDRYDRRKESNDRREYDDRRRYKDDRRRDYDDRVRYDREDESDYRGDRDRKKNEERKRKPIDNEEDNPRHYENRRPIDDTRYDRNKNNRKPPNGDDEYSNVKRNNDRVKTPINSDNEQPIVKPQSSSSIYNQPRMAPRIRPPVPKNEQNKFAYKPIAELPLTTKTVKEEKYDDYEDDLTTQRPTIRAKPESDTRLERKPMTPNSEYDDKRNFRRPSMQENRNKHRRPVEESYEDEDERRAVQQKVRPNTDTHTRDNPLTTRNRGKDLGEELITKSTPKPKIENSDDLPVPSTTKEPVRDYPDAVRIIKRPFLPSRGGNPFASRGLQPVGAKALDINQYDTDPITEKFELRQTKPVENYEDDRKVIQNARQFPIETKSNPHYIDTYDNHQTSSERARFQSKDENLDSPQETVFKPSPIIAEVVSRLKGLPIDTEIKEIENSKTNIKSKGSRENYEKSTPARNPLDINESDYDVTLNDALNPTIPNLPIRSFPTGFSANDYSYDNFNRPRYDVNYNRHAENRLQTRSPSQKIHTVVQPYSNQGERKFVALPPGPIYTNFRPSPHITHAQTHGFYSVF